MAARVPLQHFGMRSANSYIGSPLHDLNTVDPRPADIDSISDVDRDGVTEDSLDNDDDSNAVVSVCPPPAAPATIFLSFLFLTGFSFVLFCFL